MIVGELCVKPLPLVMFKTLHEAAVALSQAPGGIAGGGGTSGGTTSGGGGGRGSGTSSTLCGPFKHRRRVVNIAATQKQRMVYLHTGSIL